MPVNLFDKIPPALPEELVETLCHSKGLRVERIVSRGHASPPGFWYDQERDEFVLLLSGRARLEFDGSRPAVELAPGDWLVISAHERHRVSWTDRHQPTVWLAVHYLSLEGWHDRDYQGG